MKTIFYIDGFNLYYGIMARGKVVTSKINPKEKYPLRTNKYKWLNLEALCGVLAKSDEIVKIKYFTARIMGDDEDAKLRQKTYLDAISTLPKVEIIEGKFLMSQPLMRLVNPPPEKTNVYKLEEKGTDVNIAAQMLIDGFDNKYEKAILISNDSDLAFPIKYIKETLKKPVIVFNPQRRPSKDLSVCASAILPILNNALIAAQFPQIVTTISGHEIENLLNGIRNAF